MTSPITSALSQLQLAEAQLAGQINDATSAVRRVGTSLPEALATFQAVCTAAVQRVQESRQAMADALQSVLSSLASLTADIASGVAPAVPAKEAKLQVTGNLPDESKSANFADLPTTPPADPAPTVAPAESSTSEPAEIVPLGTIPEPVTVSTAANSPVAPIAPEPSAVKPARKSRKPRQQQPG